MVRKFTEEEKNILYKEIPVHKQKNGVGWEIWLFLIINFGLWILEMMLLINVTHKNEDTPTSDLLIGIMTFAFLGWAMVQLFLIFIIFEFIRDHLIIYPQYGQYAVENIFEIEKINIIQGESSLSLIVKLYNDKGNKIEIKTDIKLTADSLDKRLIVPELEKYRIPGLNTINMTLEEIAGVKNKYDNSYIQSWIKNFSTPAKFDFNNHVSRYSELLKTEYRFIYSQKTKEFLFIDVQKGKNGIFRPIL